MKIGDFFVELGVSADDVALKDFVRTIGEIPVATFSAVAALTALALGMKSAVSQAMDMAVGLQRVSNITGLSIDEIQKWQRVAEKVNVSGDAMAQTIIAVQQAISRIKMGTGDYRGFALFGIDPRTADPFSVMERVREFVQSGQYNQAMLVEAMQSLGISPEMMNVLKLSNQEFEKMGAAVPGMSGQQYENFLKSKQELNELAEAFKQLSISIAAFVVQIPALHSAIKGITEAVRIISDFLSKPMPWSNQSVEKGPGDKMLDFFKSLTNPTDLSKEPVATGGLSGLIRDFFSQPDRGLRGDQTINQNVTINNHGSDPQQTSAETVRQLKNMQTGHADQYFGVTEQ